jgi:hypothetical protein
MKRKLYEMLWQVETDTLSFFYREFKAFYREGEAGRYGKQRETELNDGASIEERAQDGYYFKFRGANEVINIDGFAISLAAPL